MNLHRKMDIDEQVFFTSFKIKFINFLYIPIFYRKIISLSNFLKEITDAKGLADFDGKILIFKDFMQNDCQDRNSDQ